MTSPFRNSNARYFLPSENEWYKTSYYSSSGTYFNYPTGSDTIPTAVASGTVGSTAVYSQINLGPADVTNAGGLSPYGTMGQGGNAFEWMETEIDGVNDSSGSSRGLRGGSWIGGSGPLRASIRTSFADPRSDLNNFGFRVASVPEPSGLFLAMLAGGMMFARRRR